MTNVENGHVYVQPSNADVEGAAIAVAITDAQTVPAVKIHFLARIAGR